MSISVAKQEELTRELNTLRARVASLERQQEERKLLVSDLSLLKLVVGALPEAIALRNEQGDLIYINPAHETLFGRSLRETACLNYRDFYTLESINVIDQQQISALSQNEYWEGDLEGIDAQGRTLPVWERVKLVRDAKGNILYFSQITLRSHANRFDQSISGADSGLNREERVRFEKELLERERYFQSMFNAIQDGITVLDNQFTIQQVNRKMGEIFEDQWPLEGKKCYDVYHQRDDICPWCPVVKTIKSGNAENGYVPITKEGERSGWLEISSYPLKNESGEIYGVLEHVKNITERKNAEDALFETMSIQDALLSTIPALVYLKDKKFRYIAVNKALSELTGVSMDAMKGKWDYDFFPPENADKYHRDDVRVIKTNEPLLNIEEKICAADGREIWLSTSKTPLRDQQGQPVGIVGISVDITEKKHLEEHFRQAQKMEAIGQLAGGIAHNVNNLLTGIIGNLSVAQMKAGDLVAVYLKRAQEASYRASDLVNALLVFSRKTELDLKSIPANPIVNEVYHLVRQTIDRRIDIDLELAEGLPPIYADLAQINAVLMNLCINARDAINRILEGEALPERSGDRFVITMKTGLKILEEGEYQKDVHVKPGLYVFFSVTDNGVGMEEDTQKRIYEPFYTTKHTVGTGLGLASAFGAVKQHNGWIDFTSEYGIGTTFTIYLPAMQDENNCRKEDADSSETIDDSLRGNEGILIVDDEEMILSLGQEILGEYGYKVIQARDGDEGWKAYVQNRERIDLILLDLSMPKMSGQELLKQIRLNDSKVKIIISSGYAESVDMQSLTEMGADGVITKPYYPQNLVHEVRRFLDAG